MYSFMYDVDTKQLNTALAAPAAKKEFSIETKY